MFKDTDFLDDNFYKIIDFVSANIYWKDKEGRYLGCSEDLLSSANLPRHEVIGKNDFDIWALKQEKAPPFWAGMKFFNV